MEALQSAAGSLSADPDRRAPTEVTISDPGRVYLIVKRGIDLTVALASLVLLSPAWILIAIAVKLTSRGPVFYKTTSLGLNARPFVLYKFRTMIAGADERVHRRWVAQYVKRDAPFEVRNGVDGTPGPLYKVVNDARVTTLGNYLRRTGLDEVPQFINVLRGEVSVVGPRSPRPFEYEHYDDWAKQRIRVQPGITGLYQVTARSTASFSEMVKLDLDYARRRSTVLDLWIMLRTIPVMVLSKGGY